MANDDLMLLGMSPLDIATLFAGLGCFAMMVAIWAATTVRDPMRGRVKALQERREQLKAGISAPRRRVKAAKIEATDFMRNILKRMSVLQDAQVQVAQTKLMQAGIRSRDAIIKLLFARLALPLVLGGGKIIAIYVFGAYSSYSPLVRALIAAGSLISAYKAPDVWLKNKITKRTLAIRKGLPDALDLLVICAEAGLTIDAAFNRVSKELGRAYPELGDEFGLAAIELGFLPDRRQALDNLAQRVALEEVRGVVATLIQTEKYGTPLASALRTLSAEFRNQRMMRAEEKAARLPAIMTVPLILFVLPVLFIFILGPGACKISEGLSGVGGG